MVDCPALSQHGREHMDERRRSPVTSANLCLTIRSLRPPLGQLAVLRVQLDALEGVEDGEDLGFRGGAGARVSS